MYTTSTTYASWWKLETSADLSRHRHTVILQVSLIESIVGDKQCSVIRMKSGEEHHVDIEVGAVWAALRDEGGA